MKQLFFRYLKNTMLNIFLFMLLVAAIKTNAQWVELGGTSGTPFNGFNYYIKSIATDAAGNTYAGGNFKDANNHTYVAKWNGTAWSELGGLNGSFNNGVSVINCIATDANKNIYIGAANGVVAKWNGAAWSELGGANGSPFNDAIQSITTDANGNVYAAGSFTDANNNSYVAEWNGTAWSELGGTNGSPFKDDIESISIDVSGNVYAGGLFHDDNLHYYVAKWNGTTWSEVGGTNASPFNFYITTIATDRSGNVYAAGFFSTNDSFYVAKWNGAAWSKLDASFNFSSYINSIVVDAGGSVYAGGNFIDDNGGNFVAKWNGTAWSELGETFNHIIHSVVVDSHGNVFAGGEFTDVNTHYYVAEYAQNILPVTLVNFTATKENKNVIINWQTANEANTSCFNIQRSTDGKSFANIVKIEAKGVNKVNNDYTYVDDKLSQLNSDRLYYRLQEVDNNGKLNYTGIKVIEINKNSILFTISPNPAKDYINISSSGNFANAQIGVTDLNGKTLYASKQNFTANQQIKISTSQFAKQVLIVTIRIGNGKQEFKVVKE